MPLNEHLLGQRLKEVRHAAGYSSVRKAARANGFPVSEDTLVGWESRGTNPRAFLLARVCDFYGASVEYVLGYTDDRGSPTAAAS